MFPDESSKRELGESQNTQSLGIHPCIVQFDNLGSDGMLKDIVKRDVGGCCRFFDVLSLRS